MTPRPTTSLIVAERGSAWAACADRFRRSGPDVVVLLQEKGESAAKFAVRARSRVGELVQAGRMPTQVALVSGGRTDREAIAARSVTIRAIAQEMARHEGGRMLLDSAGPDRFSMAALASTVQMLLRGSGVEIRHSADSAAAAA